MDHDGPEEHGKGTATENHLEDASPSGATLPDDVPKRLKPHIARIGKPGMGFATPWGRLFGGEILAQAVMAACATVPDTHHIHSLHGYFILAGKNEVPVMFSVERTRTGRSFMTRSVTARQENRCIFTLMVSFHKKEPGLEFEVPVSEKRLIVRYRQLGLPGMSKDAMPRPAELVAAGLTPTWDHTGSTLFLRVGFGDRWRFYWIKHAKPIQSSRVAVHCAVVAFMSDFGLIRVIRQPHDLKAAEEAGEDVSKYDPSDWELGHINWTMSMSLDHSIHFHRPEAVRADEWMLVHSETTVSAGARGLARATVFTHDDFKLIASFQQEGLIRHRPENSKL